jgi:hypothetical protein
MSRGGSSPDRAFEDLADRSRHLLEQLVCTQAPLDSLTRATALVAEAQGVFVLVALDEGVGPADHESCA